MHELLMLAFMTTAPQASGPVTWSFTVETRGEDVVDVMATATIEEGWYMYATELPSDDGPIATSIRLHPSEHFDALDKGREPRPTENYDPNFGMMVRYHSGTPRFELPLRRNGSEPFTIEGEVEFMCCTDRTCLPPKVVPFSIEVPARGPKQ
jgi:hypothetical protein